MKTSEMIAMYETNKCPEKLKFVSLGGKIELRDGILTWINSGKPLTLNLCGHNLNGPGHTTAGTIDKYDWTLVREPVPVWEAIKAFVEGKTIRCDMVSCGGSFCLSIKGTGGNNFSTAWLEHGKWYIEDSPHG